MILLIPLCANGAERSLSVLSKPFISAWVGGSVILLDQISKIYIDSAFHLHESLPVIPQFFSITYVRNPGAAFGIFASQSALFRTVLFTGVSIAALVFLFLMLYQAPKEDRWQMTALSLLLGGAVGNLLDRLRMGEVIDFLDFYIGTYHWPAFNVADSAISIGVTLLLLAMMRDVKMQKADARSN